METNPTKLLFAAPQCLSKKNSSNPIPSRVLSPAPCLSWKRSPMDVLLLAVLLLGVLLPTSPLPTAPLPPTPRELARAVLEAHGRDAGSGLRLLKLQGVTRTVGTSLGFPAGFWEGGAIPLRQALALPCRSLTGALTSPSISPPGRPPAPPAPLRHAVLPAEPGRARWVWGTVWDPLPALLPPDPHTLQQVRHCVAHISVFAFLPDAPLLLLECGRQTVRAA